MRILTSTSAVLHCARSASRGLCTTVRSTAGCYHADECRLDEFDKIVSAQTKLSDYPFATALESEVLLYDHEAVPQQSDPQCRAFEAEVASAMLHGPGIVVIRGAFEQDVIDGMSACVDGIIAGEAARGTAAGDHFAKAGVNQRIWNSLEKAAVADPAAFVQYYSNSSLATISRAWLGPAYQMTAQVNCVLPGGVAQAPHRDFHLGFLTDTQAEQYPQHVHSMGPILTLQGAVAHCDMPIESGPTTYLPHSQKYKPGYVAWRREDFKEYYKQHYMQLALKKGDAVFFNPAVFHAAGDNVSKDIRRLANLVQVSSAFGRSMESVDRFRISEAIYPALLKAAQAPGWSDNHTANLIAASAEGYPFPTNLDFDPPSDTGLAPKSQAAILAQAVDESWNVLKVRERLASLRVRNASF